MHLATGVVEVLLKVTLVSVRAGLVAHGLACELGTFEVILLLSLFGHIFRLLIIGLLVALHLDILGFLFFGRDDLLLQGDR